MKATLEISGDAVHEVDILIGANIEAGEEVVGALLSERLRNPRFLGPADPVMGIPAPWTPAPAVARYARQLELTQGLSLSGHESLFLGRRGPGLDVSIGQDGVWLRRGEPLTVTVWALAQGTPAQLHAGVRARRVSGLDYARAEFVIHAPHWHRYVAELVPDEDDDDAHFFLRLVGEGAVWIDQVHLQSPSARREETIACIRDVAPAVLRFPGGCLSTVYKWEAGTGPIERRPVLPDPVWGDRVDYAFGTDEFLELCHELDIVPHFTVTLAGGTVDDAADWAAYCSSWFEERGYDQPPIYWHIGNEQFGFWEIGRTSATEFAEVLRQWVPRIRASYPRARIVVPGPTDPIDEGYVSGHPPWRATLIAEAPEMFDVLAFQHYGLAWDWSREPTAFMQRLRETVDLFTTEVSRVADEITSTVPDKRVALTEWNLWTDARTPQRGYAEPGDGAHAVYAAAMLNGLIRLGPIVELTNYYSLLSWFGLINVRGSEVKASAVADVLRWYRDAMPATLLHHELPGPPDGVVDAVCLARGDETVVFVVNLSPGESFELAPLGDQASRLDLVAAEGPFEQAIRHPTVEIESAVRIPPLSVARITSVGRL